MEKILISLNLFSLKQIAIFLLMNLPVLGAAVIATRSFFTERDAAEKVIIASILFYVGIIISAAAAGFAGCITPPILIKIGFFFFFVSLLLSLRFSPPKKLTLSKIQTDFHTSALPHFGTSLRLSLLIAGCALLITFLWSVAAPPPPWDAFVYHLTFPARWMQEKEIFLVTVPFGDQAGTYFPSNTELFYLWFMLPFSEEFLTKAGQFLFLILLGMLIFKIAVACGIRSENALAAALITTVIPEILHQATAAEVDIVFAVLFIATLYFQIQCWKGKYSTRFFILAALSFGLFIGTKYIALPFGILLLPFFIYSIVRARDGVKRLFIFVTLTVAAGGFWYIRNWIITGNPVFPFTVTAAGYEILSGGYSRSTMLHSVFHASGQGEFLPLMQKAAGIPFLIAFVAYFPFGLRAILRRTNTRFPAIYTAVLPLLMLFIYWFVIPYNREWRFTFAIFALLSLYFAFAMEGENILSKILRSLFPLVLIFMLTFNTFLIRTAELAGSALFARSAQPVLMGMRFPLWIALFVALFFLCGIISSVFKNIRTKATGLFVAVSFISFILLLFSLIYWYPQYKYEYYTGFPIGKAWDVFHENVAPPVTVAYTGTDLSFGLFGRGLKNRVVYVNVDSHADWKFHDYVKHLKDSGHYAVPDTDRINFHRINADYKAWLRNLRRADADYLFVTVLHQTDRLHIPHDASGFPVERTWAEKHPEIFQKVYENSTTAIYRIF